MGHLKRPDVSLPVRCVMPYVAVIQSDLFDALAPRLTMPLPAKRLRRPVDNVAVQASALVAAMVAAMERPPLFWSRKFNRYAVHQRVLSVPKRLRCFMQRDAAVLAMVLCIFVRVIASSRTNAWCWCRIRSAT